MRFSPDFVLFYGTGALTRGAGIAIVPRIPHDSVFPRHARRIRLEWRTVRSIVKRILVTCAATTALALLLTMVLCALGNAMAPKWQVEPFTDHITLTTTNTTIQAVDPATGAVLKTPQEGAYRTKETHITVALDGGKP